ncbi:hypothetical protein PTTG_27798 [Puccinia triticina 1-1 BBBD Race 1]|uniref:Uncharacterized protein n=1 Tax=Puccinia triticina (isolate 1-1 / race 1 (BBBD)) TaxID=630390 RepID=A0A180GGZ4_PUCT1|nr:hypothetical protein PTTG_27798 [Puccinia triticina 1-1 BBBD Race 1]
MSSNKTFRVKRCLAKAQVQNRVGSRSSLSASNSLTRFTLQIVKDVDGDPFFCFQSPTTPSADTGAEQNSTFKPPSFEPDSSQHTRVSITSILDAVLRATAPRTLKSGRQNSRMQPLLPALPPRAAVPLVDIEAPRVATHSLPSFSPRWIARQMHPPVEGRFGERGAKPKTGPIWDSDPV